MSANQPELLRGQADHAVRGIGLLGLLLVVAVLIRFRRRGWLEFLW